MRRFRPIAMFLLIASLIFVCGGCKKEETFKVPDGMTREQAALFTAIADVCPKDDPNSKMEYLTFHIEGWSFEELPTEIFNYLSEYCRNGKANMVQMSYDGLVENGYITKGDGGFFAETENTYMLGRGKLFTFTLDGDTDSDTVIVKLKGYVSDNDSSGWDIVLEYTDGAWVVTGRTNVWSQPLLNTPDPNETDDGPIK